MLQNNPVTLKRRFLKAGGAAPALRLVGGDLLDFTLGNFANKRKVLNIFPCINTSVCAVSVGKFSRVHKDSAVVILCISSDLPFMQSRSCCVENIHNVVMLSIMRDMDFSFDYGVHIWEGPLEGITARAVLVLNENNRVIYSELVSEVTHEPDYAAAMANLE